MEMPGSFVRGAAMEAVVRQMVEEWRNAAPQDFAKWRAQAKLARESLRNEKGKSDGGNFVHAYSIPTVLFVAIGKYVGNPEWNVDEPDILEILLRVLPDAKMSSYNGQRYAADESRRRGG